MKYSVLGAGLMGKAVVYDLLKDKDTTSVLVADNNIQKLDEVKKIIRDNRLNLKIFDANNLTQVGEILKESDAAISAIHYKYNENFTKIAIKIKTNLCDLGGNSEIVDKQLKLNKEAENAGVSVIPDCGLAPGMVSVLVKWGVEKFDWVDTIKIRVGGLPQNPKGILKYERLFSIEGLINEYIEPVRVLRNGEIKIIESLTEIEEINFHKVGAIHELPLLEAFTTSGGVSTLTNTYKGRLKNLDYKTIRYKGHCEAIKELQRKGEFTKEYFENNLPVCTNDITLVKIIFEGKNKKHELCIVDHAKNGFTSMMRMTAFPASIISQMQARGEIKDKGVVPQERCIPVNLFIGELKKRKIEIKR